MSQEPQSEYQKFLNKNTNTIARVFSSCKKRLESYPKLTAEELFIATNKEYSDVYYEDRSNWLAFFKKNIPKILLEIDENLRLRTMVSEQESPFQKELNHKQNVAPTGELAEKRKSNFTEAQMQHMLHESAILERRMPRDARGLEKDDEKEHVEYVFDKENGTTKTSADPQPELFGNQNVANISAEARKKQLEKEYLERDSKGMMR